MKLTWTNGVDLVEYNNGVIEVCLNRVRGDLYESGFIYEGEIENFARDVAYYQNI